MPQILTPDTALLYSCLDLNPFDSPSPASRSKTKESEDVFSKAFSIPSVPPTGGQSGGWNNGSGPQTLTPTRSDGFSPPEFDSQFQHILNTLSPQSMLLEDVSNVQYSEQPMPNQQPTMDDLRAVYGATSCVQVPDFGFQLAVSSNADISNVEQASYYSSILENANQGPVSETLVRKTRGRRKKTMTEDTKTKKHEAFLERNRVAAGKCRLRKRRQNENIEKRCQELEERNRALKELIFGITEEIEVTRGKLCKNCHFLEEVCKPEVEPTTNSELDAIEYTVIPEQAAVRELQGNNECVHEADNKRGREMESDNERKPGRDAPDYSR